MEAKLDFKKGVAAFGLVVTVLMIVLFGYILLEDIVSLLTTGAPHIDPPGGGRSAGLRSLDIASNGWFTVAFGSLVTGFSSLQFWKSWQLNKAPESVVSVSGERIQFNKGLFARKIASLSDVVSVKLSFDPNNPKSRQNDWFWGDGKERLSISLKKPNGRSKTVSLMAVNIRGGCDALASFSEQLQKQIEASAASKMRPNKRA
jgi:hypothetical protein